MSKLQELIRELCPDGGGVQEVGGNRNLHEGKWIAKERFYRIRGRLHPLWADLHILWDLGDKDNYILFAAISKKKLRIAHKGDIVIATTSENVEDVCKAVAWLGDDDIVVSGDAYIFAHNQNPKYVSYIFQTQAFFDFKRKNQTGTKVIRVSGESLAKFEIPVPPLPCRKKLSAFSTTSPILQRSCKRSCKREGSNMSIIGINY